MSAPPKDRIRVLLIDDSAVVRGVWRRILEPEPDIEVVASSGNGRLGVEALSASPADVAILDVEMPEMDGLTALPLLRAACPGLKIIMASTLTTRGAKVTLQALSLGAADYIAKPTSLTHSGALTSVAQELIAKVRALGRPVRPGPEALTPRATPRPSTVMPRVLAIASSTGGPNALSSVLRGLPAGFMLPILIAQHMPPTFTAMLAEHLGKDSGRPSCQAESGTSVRAGEIYVAPGDYHMIVAATSQGPVIDLNQGPRENFCRPAADPLLRSVAVVYGPAALVTVLTGMGEDGRRGSEAVVRAGGTVIAQDQATSVVWGMPGAVAQAGLAAAILPLDEIPRHIARLAKVG